MKRWNRSGWPEATRKQPAPEHGIRIKKAGTTWWGKRWIEALEQVLRGDSGRLARGRTYARAGRTHDLVVASGKVAAKVTGSRKQPYDISIQLAQLSEDAWRAAIAGMAAKAQFAAELLAGHMPQDIDEVFQAASVSLFPKQRSDLVTECSCPDWGDPCKHVAAAHYVLGEALDRDPFLLFELRGKSKDEVLAALRSARGSTGEPSMSAPEIPSVTLEQLRPQDYDKPAGALPALDFSFDETQHHGAVLLQLGAPATWSGEQSPADILAPLMRAAAETARRLALTEASDSERSNTTSDNERSNTTSDSERSNTTSDSERSNTTRDTARSNTTRDSERANTTRDTARSNSAGPSAPEPHGKTGARRDRPTRAAKQRARRS